MIQPSRRSLHCTRRVTVCLNISHLRLPPRAGLVYNRARGETMERQADIPYLERVYASPLFPTYVEEMNARLETEARLRREFYEMITEEDKAEFINGEVIYHSPVMLRHTRAAKNLLVLLEAHVTGRALGFVGYEKMM